MRKDGIDLSTRIGDVYRVRRDEEYLRQLNSEAEFWDKQEVSILDMGLPKVLDAYSNEQLVGDEATPWWETIARYGPFRRGCVLGLGALKRESRIMELCPSLHLTIFDISSGALARREEDFGERFPGRVAVAAADLNFIELEPNCYDLMVSDSCMHHIINLEHVAFQINRALTPDGYFFLSDYVGESRFQFAEEKKAFFQGALEQLRSRHPVLRHWRPAWIEERPGEYSPFEAVRSQEILSVFRRYLFERSLAATNAIILLLLFLRPADTLVRSPVTSRERLRRFVLRRLGRYPNAIGDIRGLMETVGPDLIAFDREASASGRFLFNSGLGVYQKRSSSQRSAR